MLLFRYFLLLWCKFCILSPVTFTILCSLKATGRQAKAHKVRRRDTNMSVTRWRPHARICRQTYEEPIPCSPLPPIHLLSHSLSFALFSLSASKQQTEHVLTITLKCRKFTSATVEYFVARWGSRCMQLDSDWEVDKSEQPKGRATSVTVY